MLGQTAERNKGATLTSFMVAAALAGIVGLTIMRLATTQGKALFVISLLEEREHLLKHYVNILVSGWDKTRTVTNPPFDNTPLNVYDRDGTVAIKSDGTTTPKHPTPTGKPWWTIKAFATDVAASAVRVRVTISFDDTKHTIDNLGKVIADREEWVYLHSPNITASESPALNTDCRSNAHPSRKGLYSGQGALVQYDFNTNYAKCSNVPLVQDKVCSTSTPIIGIDHNSGEPICSSNHVSIVAGQCLGSGQFLVQIKADGKVACNKRTGGSARVAIVMGNTPKNKQDACGIIPFSEPLNSRESHILDETWLTPPVDKYGNPRGPAGNHSRRTIEKAGGIRGIRPNGTLRGCSLKSKGGPGEIGDPGPKAPKGPTGPPLHCGS